MTYAEQLREAQNRFARHVAYLINFIQSPENGFKISLGEVMRTEYQQAEYLRTGFSKTKDSKHLLKLAIDINFFLDGRLLLSEKSRHDEDLAILKPIGEYWTTLHPKNVWGGNFTGAFDMGHFQTDV